MSIAATAGEALNKANACLDAAHGHENKVVLDSITSDDIASWNSAATKTTQNSEAIDTLSPIVTGNQTDITALKASVNNLQDADVEISKNIANVNSTATTANNKADRALEILDTAYTTHDRIDGTAGGDLNTALNAGCYRYTGNPLNTPTVSTDEYGLLFVIASDAYIIQTAYANCSASGFQEKGGVFTRGSVDSGTSWSPWLKQTMEVVDATAVTSEEAE